MPAPSRRRSAESSPRTTQAQGPNSSPFSGAKYAAPRGVTCPVCGKKYITRHKTQLACKGKCQTAYRRKTTAAWAKRNTGRRLEQARARKHGAKGRTCVECTATDYEVSWSARPNYCQRCDRQRCRPHGKCAKCEHVQWQRSCGYCHKSSRARLKIEVFDAESDKTRMLSVSPASLSRILNLGFSCSIIVPHRIFIKL